MSDKRTREEQAVVGKTVGRVEEHAPGHDGEPDESILVLHFTDGTALEIVGGGFAFVSRLKVGCEIGAYHGYDHLLGSHIGVKTTTRQPALRRGMSCNFACGTSFRPKQSCRVWTTWR